MQTGFYSLLAVLFVILSSACAVDPTDSKLVGERVPPVYQCNAFAQECTIKQGDSQLRYRAFKLGNNKYRVEGHVKRRLSSGSSKITSTVFAYYFVKNNVIVAVGPRFSITGGEDNAFKKEITGPEESGDVLEGVLQPDNILLAIRLMRIAGY